MRLEKEIEFKTEINKQQYKTLMSKYNLENHIYKLTNYYFETADKSLIKDKEIIRIRVKNDNDYNLTLKKHQRDGALENHLTLTETDALLMIVNGFNLKSFFNRDVNVYPYGKLTTYRASRPYKDGELFLDKIDYYGNIKYEIEYEARYHGIGHRTFLNFLKDNKIKPIPTIKKSSRVFNYLKENNA